MQHSKPQNQVRNSQHPKLSVLAIALSSALTSTLLFSGAAFAETSAVNLPQVDVNAERISDTKPVKGYNAKKSVSSTRTETELRDTPQAITVIPQDLIKDQSIQSISEAIRYVPGVQAAQGEGNRDALIFRGNATTGDFFIDGLRDDVQTYRDIYNTDRIEVLKGPNGMAFGRGGAGGALNRVSKQAGWTPISELIASYGAYNQKRIAADYGQALNEEVAFRVNAVYENSDSYRDGVNLERFGITPTVTIRPDDKTKIVVGMEYFKDKRVADRGVPSVNGPGNSTLKNRPYRIGDYDTFFGNAHLSPTETETVAFNASIEHSFDNGLNVKNSTRYANYNKYYQNVFARNAVNNAGTVQFGAYLDETERENFINQTDLTFNAKTGFVEHKLLFGMELAQQDTTSKRFQPTVGSTNIATAISASNPFLPTTSFAALATNRKSDVSVAAFYLQDQIIFTPHWQAIIGLRNDNFNTRFSGTTFSVANPDGVSSNINVSDNLLAPRAGLIFKPVEAVSIYTNYSVSYVPRAGDQLTSLTPDNASFKPEKFTNYEVGAKWDVNSNLALTAAVYKLKRENVLITDPNNPGANSILVDGQETKGIELGVSGDITNKWSVFGGIALQDGEITETQINATTPGSTILKGTELAQTPDRTLSLWNKYEINDMWAVALGIVSTSDRYAALPTVSQSTILPGYTRYDAAIYGKLNEKLRLQINLENLTNKEYALYSHTNNNITPGSPITGRATLIYSF